MNDKISVIIPVYNGEKYLQNAIESVLKQTYNNYEIIVIDDGSTDKSQEILAPYLDKLKYIKQKNQGVAKARNQGLEIATGEYIAFLDQDDFWLENKLELQLKIFQKNPEISIIHSGWNRINSENKIIGKMKPWQKIPHLDFENWLRWKPVLLGAMMFKKNAILKIGGLDSKFKQLCDLDLVLRLSLAGAKTQWLQEITLNYREHDSNDSLNTIVQSSESIALLNKLYSLPNLPITIKDTEQEQRYYTLIWCAWRLYYTNHLKEMTDYLEKSWQYKLSSPTETLLHWVEAFTNYSEEKGEKIDFYQLTNTAEWQQLIIKLFR